jgi:predicted Zn-dependent peptidase
MNNTLTPDAEYDKTVLDNGLRLLTAPMPHARSASVVVFLGVGSRYEAPAESGLAHFIEHMLFKGTARRPTARDISTTIEGVGGLLNAVTSQETTVYWAKIAQPHLALALDLLVDVLRHSSFAPPEIEKERQVILEEIDSLFDSPGELVGLLIDQLLWDGPLGWDIAGRKDTISAFQRADLLAYLARHYAPGNTVISVAGSIDPLAIREQMAALLGDWSPAPPASCEPALDNQTAPRLKVHYKDTEQVHLCLGVHGLPLAHPDRFVLGLLSTILGEGMSSRLFEELREKRGLAYDVHSYVDRFQDTGSAVVYAAVDPQRTVAAVEVILEELARLKDQPVPEAELTTAQDLTKGRFWLSLEDSRNVASWLGSQELLLGRIQTVDEVIAQVEAVTSADIQRLARQLFIQGQLNLALVGPFKKEGRFAGLLKL